MGLLFPSRFSTITSGRNFIHLFPAERKVSVLRNMAVQSSSEIIATHLNKTQEVIFPLIVHVTPIWPPEKRIEIVKARRTTFRRLVRNKMIIVKFLQSISPSFKGFASEVAENVDDKDSIVTLTRNFCEEQRQKRQRIYEIQMEAYLREERKKTAWGRARENDWSCGWQKLPKASLAASNDISNNSAVQTFKKDFQLTNEKYQDTHSKFEDVAQTNALYRRNGKAKTTRRSKEMDAVFGEHDEAIYFPQLYRPDKDVKHPVNDPRFERLMALLVPPAKKNETGFSSRDASLTKRFKDKASILQNRLNGKSLHEKWLETMEPNYNKKNASRTNIHN